MRFLLILVLTCATIAVAQNPQTTQSTPTNQKQESWADIYRSATISFGRVVEDHGQRVFQVLGTGIVVIVPKKDRFYGFIVTAKHMFYDPAQSWHPAALQVRFAWQENKSLTEEFGTTVKLISQTGENLWSSPADGADVAALPLKAGTVPEGITLRPIELGSFADAEDIYDGASVLVFGYPSLAGNSNLVRAITRGGVIAWTDPSGPANHPFLIDANILPGNSGGPVLKMPTGIDKNGHPFLGGTVKILGIVSQDISEFYVVQADGRIVQVKFPDLLLPSIEQVQVTGIGGIGKVEPAPAIKRFLLSLVAMSPS